MKKKRKIIKTTTYEDRRTGEVKSGRVQFIDCSFDEEKGYLFWNRKKFAKTFQDVEYPEDLSMIDRGRLATLAKKIYSNTNMLGYRGNGGVRPYDIEGIGQLVGLKKSQAYSFVNRMIEKKFLKSVPVKFGDKIENQYYMNPVYFFSSNRLNLNLYLLFREELDSVLPEWVKNEYASVGIPGGG